MTALTASFRKPFAEQVAAFRLRLGNLTPTVKWDDIQRAQHDRAFMVAGAQKADLLADLAAAIDKAVAQGTGLEEFRRDFRTIVERRGWHGWTGEGTKGGEAWRTKVIYKTNMATTYAAGRMAQLAAGNFAFWVYRHGGSLEPREQHLSWDGLILPPDHPFWATHAPPNGWGCSCYIVGARTLAGAKRVGGKTDVVLPKDWAAPSPKTGAPVGIDKGWDYAPGASVARVVAAMAEKTVHWPYEIAKAFMQSVPAATASDIAVGYRALASTRSEVERFARTVSEGLEAAPYKTLGLLTHSQARNIEAALKIDTLDGFDFALDPSTVRHILKQHGSIAAEALRGQIAVGIEDFPNLPALIDSVTQWKAVGVSGGSGRPLVQAEVSIDGEIYVLTFEIRKKRRMLALVTMFKRALK